MTPALVTDIFRWWSVAAALISIVELAAHVPILVSARRGSVAVPIMDVSRAFFTTLSLFGMCSAIMIAGAIIPIFGAGRFFGFGPEHEFYAFGMALAWLLWSTSSWLLAISYAERRWAMVLTALIWLCAVTVALDAFPGAGR